MMSRRTRSPKRMARVTRRSSEAYGCVMPRLRPRLPLDRNDGSTSVPSLATDGRSFELWRSALVSVPVRMLKGRPEEISRIGAMEKSARKRCAKLSPLRHEEGEPRTALKTKRWRWSKSESERSQRRQLLFCGFKSVCRSDDSSIECDHV